MSQDLFSFYSDQELQKTAPLADRLRPINLDEFFGQEEIVGESTLLRKTIQADKIGNFILQGPPGVGKTTLAKIIAENTRCYFCVLNAVLAGVKELRKEVEFARERLGNYGLRTILFIDEVHRLNAAQQDALLPWVENGTFIFIGATTENPYFEVNKALVSRSRVFRLKQLTKKHLQQLLSRALKDITRGYGSKKIKLTSQATNHLIDIANGDARSLLNALELAVETTAPDQYGYIKIDLSIAEQSIQEKAILYDQKGDNHFDTISAFIKSMRGSDPDATLFWLAQMLEAGERPRYIFRRMLIAASEDIGLADPQAIVVVSSCADAFERVGMPEGIYLISQAALYLACAQKSNSVLGILAAKNAVNTSENKDVPLHLRDPSRDKLETRDGVGYQYPHDYSENWTCQTYLPKTLEKEVFWNPTEHGWEGKIKDICMQRKKAQITNDLDSL